MTKRPDDVVRITASPVNRTTKAMACALAILAWGWLGSTGCKEDSRGSRDDAQVEQDGGLDSSVHNDGSQTGDAHTNDDGSIDPDSGQDASTPCIGPQVLRYDTYEVTLQASQGYNGTSGSPNPFTEVDLTATVTAPDNRTIQVEGFYDGDGAGGNNGQVFKIRIFADQPGQWSYVTHSTADSGLDGQTGQFCVQGTLAGRFGAGPVLVNPAHPHTFMLANGDPIYLIGKFLDVAAPDPIKFSHTMFSEHLSDADRQAMLDRHVGMGLNKINVYLANRGDYGGVSTTPWVGDAGNNDKSHFDLGRWHMYDEWGRKIRDAGLVAQFWFFADDSDFGPMSDADKQRLIRYGMARMSGYANTMFTLCLEWEEGWSPQAVNTNARFLQQHNPWARLVSVHGQTGDFDYPNEAWANYMDIQSGNDASPSTVHAMGLHNRGLADKPLINEEFGLGDENDDLRRRAWAAFTAGAGGSGTGAFLQHLAAFTTIAPFELMDPHDELVTSGSGYCLAAPGTAYVVYLINGGQITLDLSAASGAMNVTWFDPRTGSQTNGGTVTGGSVQSFSAPGAGDWTLLVTTP
ncbi:MAG: DUF5060 domain-containing protein [Deltaproteobacteria bacterium]|nr:DUF5060 domain-containing protein [Deltaproteobacteria bacterium]